VSLPSIAGVARATRTLITTRGRARRVVWTRPGRVHIEVRGSHRVAEERLVAALYEAFAGLEGINWHAWNAALCCVIVDCALECDENRFVAAVETVEHDLETASDPVRSDGRRHPADDATATQLVAELAIEGTALYASFWGQLARWSPIPIELASAVSFLDSQPGLRARVERAVGKPVADVGFSMTSAVAQGLAQGPSGLIVDIAHRGNMLAEHVVRRRTWDRREAELVPSADAARASSVPHGDRPTKRPTPPADLYAQRIGRGALAAGVGLSFAGRGPLAGAVFTAGLSKAVQTSRQAFAAQLDRSLTRTGSIVLDPAALRVLEQVDAVVSATAGELTAEIRAASERSGLSWTAAGDRPTETVRALQQAGHVVAMVGTDPAALAAADVAIAGLGPERIGWHADVLAIADHVPLLIDSVAAARACARCSVALAAGGSATAALIALVGLGRQPARAASTVVNATGVVGFVLGTRDAGRLQTTPARRPQPEAQWHSLPAAEVVTRLDTSPSGLSLRQVARRARHARQVEEPSLFALLGDELTNPLTPILGAGALASAALGSVVDAALVTSVLAGNAVLGVVQRVQTQRAVRALEVATEAPVRVRRAGTETTVALDAVVPGDIALLEAGDVVPADCRVLEAAGLMVDESSLTGEAFPVFKRSDPDDEDAGVADRASMLYTGTTVVAGTAVVVAVAVGDATEAAAAFATGAGAPPPTGVERRLAQLTRITVPVTAFASGFVTLNGLLRGRPLRETLATGVGLAVAAIPEGLPVVSTIAQLAAAQRLSTRNAIVRTPRTIEALGRVDVLCFDKTGTLTEGNVVLHGVSIGRGLQRLPSIDRDGRTVLEAALRATALEGDGNGNGRASSADHAVVAAADAAHIDADWIVAAELPFEHDRPFHAIRAVTPAGCSVVVKGAPEVLFSRCVTWRQDGVARQFDAAQREAADAEIEELAAQGYRLLAVAERSATMHSELVDEDVRDLELLGFVAFADRVRSSAQQALWALRNAAVDIVMITGDHPVTAEAVAADLGLLKGRRVLSGPDLDGLADEELDAIIETVGVFARVTPAHKARIVASMQRRDRVVAMTGDGTNDAGAIRMADCGVALGHRATPAARHAADVVVTDDRLETIIDAIIEGRAMWASVRDALAILLGGNLGEVAFAIAVGAVTGGSPLNARQMLLVNLLTDVLPAATIAARPPRKATQRSLLSAGPDTELGDALRRDIVVRAAITGGSASAAWFLARPSGRRRRADTVGLVSLVSAQLGQTVVASGGSPAVLVASVLSAGVLGAAVQVPGMSQFFGCTPLGPVGWAIGLGTAGLGTAASIAASQWEAKRISSERAQPGLQDLSEEPLGEQERQFGQYQREQLLHRDLRDNAVTRERTA
jgi:cation-transporting ATPase I